MKRKLTKRLAAWFMVLCFVLMQMNLPAGCLKLDLSFLNAHAEKSLSWQYPDVNMGSDETGKDIILKSYVFTYSINDDNESVTVTGYDADAMKTYMDSLNPTLHFSDDNGYVTLNGKEYKVTAIGDKCMNGAQTFTSVIIPQYVETIGDLAFNGCNQNLQVVDFSKNTACTSIGEQAFYQCTKLGKLGDTLTLPKSLQKVGQRAFASCPALTKVNFTSDYVSLGKETFSGDTQLTVVKLPENTPPQNSGNTSTLTGEGIFSGCTQLVAINIPNQSEIPANTFYNCSSLCTTKAAAVLENSNSDFSDEDKILNFKDELNTTQIIGENSFYGTGFAKLILSKVVTTIGVSAFEGASSLRDIDFTDCDNGGADHTLTIGENAFRSTKKLGIDANEQTISIVFANCITSIGDYAFASSQLQNAYFHYNTNIKTLGKGVFSGAALAQFVIPDTIDTISENMFANCPSLHTVSIPKSLTTIETGAFQSADSFSELQLRANKITAETENNTATAGVEKDFSKSGITKIGSKAFSSTKLSSFTLPKAVTTLGKETFSECKALLSFTFAAANSASIPYIFENDVFSGCSELTSISIPYGIESIGESVFFNCSKLESVTVGNNGKDASSYTTLPGSIFNGCKNLKEFELPASCTSIEGLAFKNCTSLTKVTNTSQITAIGNSAFENCTSLTGLDGKDKLALPAGLESLGTSAFAGCTKLTSLTSTGGLTSIADTVFSGCSRLETIQIGSTVKNILLSSFEGVPVKDLDFESTDAVKFGDQSFTFSGSDLNSITCYEDLKETYKESFKKLGITIPDSKFKTKKRNTDKAEQNSTSLEVGINAETTLQKGTDFILKDASGGNATNKITWKIADETIAAITPASDGSNVTITGKTIGKTTLTGSIEGSNESLSYNIYVTPSRSSNIENPYTSVTIYDVSSLPTSKLSADKIEKAIKENNIQPLEEGNVYFDSKGTKTDTLTLYASGNLEKLGSPTKDSIYWRFSDTDSASLATITAPEGTKKIENNQDYYQGSLIKVTPSTDSGKFSIEAVTIKNEKSVVRYSIQAIVQEIVAAKNVTMEVNTTDTITSLAKVTKEPANSNETLLYSIPEEQQSIATIDEDGTIIAKKIGTATVTITSSVSNASTTVDVTVCNPIVAVNISKTEANTTTSVEESATLEVFQGDSFTLSFTSTFKDGSQLSKDELKFETVNPAVATLSTPSVTNNITSVSLSGLGSGSTQLIITDTESDFKTTLTIQVKTALNSISIDEPDKNKTVALGETLDLSNLVKSNPTNHNETLTWESNNTAVATVSKDGIVTAVSPGTALITVYCHRTGKSAQFTITTDNTILSAKTTPESIGGDDETFYPGASKTVGLEITKKNESFPASDGGVTWSSSNEKIVTVSGGSLTGATITAVAAGSANIIVKNAEGAQLATISVTVASPSIELDHSSITLYTKIAKRKAYTIKPVINGYDKNVTYKVTKGANFIKVSSNGKVTYKNKKKAGTGVVTITANGVSTTLNVTVDKVTKKKLSVSNSAGQLKKKTITVKKSEKSCTSRYTASWSTLKVTYKSSKKKVASIDKNGEIKLKKKGTTKITTTVDGYKMTYTLKVK